MTIGRRTEEPTPNIIFGGSSVYKNHARLVCLNNGLIRFEITEPKAL